MERNQEELIKLEGQEMYLPRGRARCFHSWHNHEFKRTQKSSYWEIILQWCPLGHKELGVIEWLTATISLWNQ